MNVCPQCKGVGKVNTLIEDEKTGAAMRKLREAKGLTLRAVASKMKKSPAYLSMLEHGRQRWNPELVEKFKEAL